MLVYRACVTRGLPVVCHQEVSRFVSAVLTKDINASRSRIAVARVQLLTRCALHHICGARVTFRAKTYESYFLLLLTTTG